MGKRFLITTMLMCFLLVLSGCSSDSDNNGDDNDGTIPDITWDEHYDNDADMITDSDIIVTGMVLNSYTVEDGTMVYTHQILQVGRVVKFEDRFIEESESAEIIESNSLNMIEVPQVGGEYDGKYTEPVSESPLCEVGGEYIFILEKTDEGRYLLMAGRQGSGEINAEEKLVFAEENVYTTLDGQERNAAIEKIKELIQ